MAESFLTWLAVRYLADRIDPVLASAIESTIPNRLAYFDRQNFDLSPLAAVPEPATLGLFALGAIAVVRRGRAARLSATE